MWAPLLDVCDFQGGTQPPKEEWVDDFREGYVRMLQIRDYSQGKEKFVQYVKDTEKLHKCASGDLMLSRYGYIGQVFTGLEGAYNVALVKVIKKRPVDTKYLYYYFQSEYFRRVLLSSVGARATVPGFNKSELAKAEIPLPSLSEQIEIGEKLGRVDAISEQYGRQLAKLDELARARFIELFGDPEANPFHWRRAALKDVAADRLTYGSGASSCAYDGDVRYVRITDINDSGELNGDIVSPSVVEDRYLLKDGDILFARSGATVGKAYRYRASEGRCLYAGYLIRLIPDQRQVLPDYIFYYTKTSCYKNFIASNRRVAAQPNMNARQYGELRICVPPIDRQREFASAVQKINRQKWAVRQSLDKLELFKKALMQQYFR